jgi:hypothetical protein
MNILSIEASIVHDSVEERRFRSTTSFLDYDVIIWNPNFILEEYKSHSSNSTFRGLKRLSDNDSALIKQDMNRRKTELYEMLKLGRSIVVMMTPPQKCYVDSGRREYSGTGRNRATTTIVEDIDVLSILPKVSPTIEATGDNIEFRGEKAFEEFWIANKDNFSYDAYYNEPFGKPFLFIKGTDKVVGTYLKVENGNLIFMPTLINGDSEDIESVDSNFITSLTKLIKELKSEAGDFELPSWSQAYSLPDEAKCRDEILQLENNLNILLNKISKEKESLAKIEEYKLLFTGTGKALEIMVKNLFEKLGFKVNEGLPGRDDLIIQSQDGKIAVVEIKGVTKSAAEKHAAQLEKWVSEYYSMNDFMPKGILIVNAFKDTPLAERKSAAFPNQMLQYSKSRNHCLMTGLQLLDIYFETDRNDERKVEIINKIFNTKGILDHKVDIDKYLIREGALMEKINV